MTVRTNEALKTRINSLFSTNDEGDISAGDLRSLLTDLVDSKSGFAEVGTVNMTLSSTDRRTPVESLSSILNIPVDSRLLVVRLSYTTSGNTRFISLFTLVETAKLLHADNAALYNQTQSGFGANENRVYMISDGTSGGIGDELIIYYVSSGANRRLVVAPDGSTARGRVVKIELFRLV